MNRSGVVIWSLAIGLGAVCTAVMAQTSDPGVSPTASSEAAPAEPEASLDAVLAPQQEPAQEPQQEPQQEPASAPVPQPQRAKREIEEVIVTAQRREENAQDVAVSVTVFNQEQLTNANITNASDLVLYTPSLSANTRFGSESAGFSIRGFTQDLRTTASVATYFAEVVAPRGQNTQNSGDGAAPGTLFDLQNVQVLKGPQGTLFGRNTTGGAVLLVPNKPTDKFEGYVESSGGDFTARRVQAVANLPVTDWFKLRFGVDGNDREGYLHNISGIGADDLGNVGYAAYRLSTVLNVTDAIENYTILSDVDSHTHGYTTRLFACNPDVVSSPVSVLPGMDAKHS